MALKLKIKEPILYSYITNKVLGTDNIDKIKRIFGSNDGDKKDELSKIEIRINEEEKNISEYVNNIFGYVYNIKNIKIDLRYYQFLGLLYTEIYLDNYFKNKEKLKEQINKYIEEDYVETITDYLKLKEDKKNVVKENLKLLDNDLTKILFRMATGSGKSYISLFNKFQFDYYKEKYNQEQIKNTIFITLNDDLLDGFNSKAKDFGIGTEKISKKDITNKEFKKVLYTTTSGIQFIAEGGKIKEGESFYIVEGENYGNNLLLVDEAHYGTGNGGWISKENQETLKGDNGMIIGYSATFNSVLENETEKLSKKDADITYIKTILFDYNYHKFHDDNYGKDYDFIFASGLYSPEINNKKKNKEINVKEDVLNEFSLSNMYFFLCQLDKYLKMNEEKKESMENYYKPLMLYVGSYVKGKTQSVLKIINYYKFLVNLYNEIDDDTTITKAIQEKVNNTDNSNLLINKIIKEIDKKFNKGNENKKLKPLLKNFFNIQDSNNGKQQLKIEIIDNTNTKDKESMIIGSYGNEEPFLAVYVSDSKGLLNFIKDNNEDKKIEIFEHINSHDKTNFTLEKFTEKDNSINVLIGTSKKFGVGYDNFRISTIGLLDIEKSEVESIQLFGRGVRLKGKNNDGKRCYTELGNKNENGGVNKDYYNYKTLETLFIYSDKGSALKNFLKINKLDTTKTLELNIKIENKNDIQDEFENLPTFQRKLDKDSKSNILNQFNKKDKDIYINSKKQLSIKNLSNAEDIDNDKEKNKKDSKEKGKIIIKDKDNKSISEDNERRLFISYYFSKINLDNYIYDIFNEIFTKKSKNLIDENKEENNEGKIIELTSTLSKSIKSLFGISESKDKDNNPIKTILKTDVILNKVNSFSYNKNSITSKNSINGKLLLNNIDKNEYIIKELINNIISQYIKQNISNIINSNTIYNFPPFSKNSNITNNKLKEYKVKIELKSEDYDGKGVTPDGKEKIKKILKEIGYNISELKEEEFFKKLFEDIIIQQHIDLNKYIDSDYIIEGKNRDSDNMIELGNHYYNPILYSEKDSNIKIEPNLVDSEQRFLNDLKDKFRDNNFIINKDGKNYKIYLMRNISKKGLSFFNTKTGKNKYSDFIMWLVNKDDKDDIKKVLIEPHGIIQDYINDKGELKDISLLPELLTDEGWNLFTLYPNKPEGENVENIKNLFYMDDDKNYIVKILEQILSLSEEYDNNDSINI